MKKVRIVVDSCSDIDLDSREKYGIEWARNFMRYEDGREIVADINWQEYSPQELYDYVKNKGRLYSSQVTVNEFERVFSECAERGEDVVYTGCSSALSGSVNTARMAKDKVLEKYPDTEIYVVDTLRASLAAAIIAIDAAKLALEGKSAKEVADYVERNKLNYHMVGTVETLDYLKRAGRIKASSAFFGNLFGVKPVIIADAKGNNYALKKIRGRQSTLKEIVLMAKEDIIDAENQCVWIGNAVCEDEAEFLRQEVESVIKPGSTKIWHIGPTVGSNTGPGMISLFYKGTKVEVNQ